MRGAETNGDLKIVAHAHAEIRQAVTGRYLRKQGEMRRWLGADWRDAHKPVHRERQRLAAQRDEGVCLARGDTSLLRFFARVHLYEQSRASLGFFERRLQDMGKLWSVQRMNRVEQFDGFANLVRLQAADKMEFDVFVLAAQRRPLTLRFLNPIFAKDAVTGRERGSNTIDRMCLGNGDERRRRWRRNGSLPRGLDPRKDGG